MKRAGIYKWLDSIAPCKGSFTQTKVCPFGMGYAPAPRCFAFFYVLVFILCKPSDDDLHLPVGCV